MRLLANAIFPAFFIPYLFVAMTPWLIPIVIGIEWWFLFRANRRLSWLVSLTVCVIANVVSSLAGVLLLMVVPHDILPAMVTPEAAMYKAWVLLSLSIFCALSALIEGGIYLALRKFIPLESVWRPVVVGNVTGYAVIAVGLIAGYAIHA